MNQSIPQCPRCNIPLKVGKAIDPKPVDRDYCFSMLPYPDVTIDSLSIMLCWKCVKCGHSETV